MGLLDRLVNRTVNRVVDRTIDQAVNKTVNSVSDSISNKASNAIDRAFTGSDSQPTQGNATYSSGTYYDNNNANTNAAVKCEYCGTVAAGGTKFCPQCGAKLPEQPVNTETGVNYGGGGNTVELSTLRRRFQDAFRSEFSDFIVQENVPAATIFTGAPSYCKPYDFVLIKNGYVAGVVMLTPHNRDNNRAFLSAKAAAGRIPFINFYTHYPNVPEYIVSRLKKFLR